MEYYWAIRNAELNDFRKKPERPAWTDTGWSKQNQENTVHLNSNTVHWSTVENLAILSDTLIPDSSDGLMSNNAIHFYRNKW